MINLSALFSCSTSLASAGLALTLALGTGCLEGDDGLPTDESSGNVDPGSSGGGASGGAVVLECRKDNVGRTHTGFDGASLAINRSTKALGIDRSRVKPYPVLYGEMERVLGTLPQAVGDAFFRAAPSFELPPPRWYDEPKATGVGMSAYYNVAFVAALAHVEGKPSFAALPTASSAKEVCETMAHSAWRKRPAQAEIDRCVELATTKLAKESNPKRRWAYVIASVLSTPDFLSY
jgi:hypothetical protein